MIPQQMILPDQLEIESITRIVDISAGGRPAGLASPRAGVANAFPSCPSGLEPRAGPHTSGPRAGRAPMMTGRMMGPARRRPHHAREIAKTPPYPGDAFRSPNPLLQPDLLFPVVLADEVVGRPVGEPIGNDQAGILLLRIHHLLVEGVLGHVPRLDLVVDLEEPVVELIAGLDDLDALGDQFLARL